MSDEPSEAAAQPPETLMRVGEIAELYLGNILFALERAALSLDAEEKAGDAAFYRGLGRALADAHGRQRD